MAHALIIIGAVALDWGLAWLVWRVLLRVLGDGLPARVSAVMPWALLQISLVVGLIATGVLARSTVSAILLTGVPVAIFAAFFALPVAFFRPRGATAIDLHVCLDHTYATALVWSVAFLMGVVL